MRYSLLPMYPASSQICRKIKERMQLKNGGRAGGGRPDSYKTVRIAKSEFQEIPSVSLFKMSAKADSVSVSVFERLKAANQTTRLTCLCLCSCLLLASSRFVSWLSLPPPPRSSPPSLLPPFLSPSLSMSRLVWLLHRDCANQLGNPPGPTDEAQENGADDGEIRGPCASCEKPVTTHMPRLSGE